MAQIVTLPNGNTVEFPDDMSADAMSAAISSSFPDLAPRAQSPSILDRMRTALGKKPDATTDQIAGPVYRPGVSQTLDQAMPPQVEVSDAVLGAAVDKYGFAVASQAQRGIDEQNAVAREAKPPAALKVPETSDGVWEGVKGLAKGNVTDLGKQGGALFRLVGQWVSGEAVGNPELQQVGQNIDEAGKYLFNKYSRREQREQPQYDSMLGRGVYSGLRSLEQMAVSIMIAGPRGALGYMTAGQVGLPAAGEAMDKGLGTGEAVGYAAGQAGIEYVTEKLPMGYILDKFGKEGVKRFVQGFLARELPGELVATATQNALEQAVLHPEKSWAEYRRELPDQLAETGVAVATMGGALGGLHAGAKSLDNFQAAARADRAKQNAMSTWSGGFAGRQNPAARHPANPADILNAPDLDSAVAAADKMVSAPVDLPGIEDIEGTPISAEPVTVAGTPAVFSGRAAESVAKDMAYDAAQAQRDAEARAERQRLFDLAEQARRDADYERAVRQAAEQNAAQAEAVTRAQGFDATEPTAIALAFQRARQNRAEAVAHQPTTEGEANDLQVQGQEATQEVNFASLDVAAHEAATSPRNDLAEPTEAQKAAGNYKKGHLNFDGLDLTIENPIGSERSGKDLGGNPWSVTMTAHYGYLKRSEGADGDQVDVYLVDQPKSGSPVFVFDQYDADGKFDEHKAVAGVATQAEAERIYDAHFSDGSGPARRRGVVTMSVAEFKDWARNGDTSRPLARMPAAPNISVEAPNIATAQRVGVEETPLNDAGSAITPEKVGAGDTVKSVERIRGKLAITGFAADEIREAAGKLRVDVRVGQDGKALVSVIGRSGNAGIFTKPQEKSLRDALLGKDVRQANRRKITGNLRNDLNALHPGLYAEVERGGDGEATGRFDLGAIAEELRDEYGYAQIPHGDAKDAGEALIDMIRQGGAVNEDRMLAGRQAEEARKERDEIDRLAAEYGVDTHKGIVRRKQQDVTADLMAAIEHETGVAGNGATAAREAAASAGMTEAEISAIEDRIADEYFGDPAKDAMVQMYRAITNELQGAIDARIGLEEGGQDGARPGEGARAGAAARGAREERPDFTLERQTEAELSAKAARENDQAIADRETADQQREAFALSAPEGSAAPKAAPSQQAGLFTATGQTSQAAAQTPAGQSGKPRVEDSTQPFAGAVPDRSGTTTIAERAAEGNAPEKTVAEMSPADLLRAAADKMDAEKKAAEKSGADETVNEPVGEIEDFGEKLGGARKDQAAALRDAVTRELTDEEIASQPLSKIWPKESIDQIEDTFIAAVAHAARAEIPSKPRQPYKVRGWVERVKVLRGLTGYMLRGTVSKEKFAELLKGRSVLEHFYTKVSLLESIGRQNWDRIGYVQEWPDSYTYAEDGKTQIPTPLVLVEIDGKRQRYDASSVADVLGKVRDALGEAPQAKKMEFEVRGQPGRYAINKKGDPLYRKLKTFETTKEAFDYRASHYDDLVAAWEAVKDSDNVKESDVRRGENRPRSAEDWRKGKDVTPEQFQDAFGFRGIEFGNWVTQGKNDKERQGMLNQAYDALMDLASIIGVPPKAMSLNGTLGLGFGSRGSGKFAAHFEPDMLVINLTKTRGAGSLAHEWFHALDNYFQSQRGKGTDFITNNPENYFVHKRTGQRIPARKFNKIIEEDRAAGYGQGRGRIPDLSQWELKEGVRPEVGEAFADLVKALNDSPMAKRASLIDKGGSGGYWSRIIERGARSFENYVIHKMMLKGYHNDYLANVTSIEEFIRDPGRYPYLLEGEIQPVADAFDNLFATIQTKETANGVAMFSRITDNQPDRIHIEDLVAVGKKARAVFPGIQINVLEDERQAPRSLRDQIPDAGAEGEISGAYHEGELYLFKSGIRDLSHAEETVVHEATHGGLRRIFGSDLHPVMLDIHKSNLKVRAKAFELSKKYGYSTVRSTEEVLADMGPEVKKLKGWDRLVAWLRNKLRAFGIVKEWTDNDIEALILRALAAVKKPAGTHITRATERPHVGIWWDRVTGATGDPRLGRKGATYFSRTDQKTPATAGVSASEVPETFGLAERSPWTDFVYKYQDKYVDLKDLIASINKTGKAVADAFDPYLQEELYHKRVGKRTTDFFENEFKPLLVQMLMHKVEQQEFEEYLLARHAREANALIRDRGGMADGGSGMTDAEADDYFSKLDAEKRRQYENLAKRVDAMLAGTRATLVHYGLESKDTVDGWAKMFAHYVPLYREDMDEGQGIGQGFSVRGPAAKHRTGSARKVADILSNIAQQRDRAIVRGEKNRVAVALYGLAYTNPSPDVWEVDRAPQKQTLDKSGQIVDAVDPLYKSRPNVIVARIKGKNGEVHDRAVVFNDRNKRAVRLAEALKNLDAPHLEGVIGISAKVTRYVSAMSTQYNPVFVAVNFARDFQSVALNLSSTPLAGRQAEVAGHALSALRGIFSDLRDHRAGKTPTSKWAALYEEMQLEGGTTGYRDMFASAKERTAEQVEKLLDPEWWAKTGWGKVITAGGILRAPEQWLVSKPGAAMMNWISDLNETAENSMRLAVYKTAIDHGISKPRAASLAKNISVNFNRKGQVGAQMNALYAFFNAAVQGTARLAETMRGPAGRQIVAGGILLGVMQAFMMAAAGFDDDDPPDFVRERSLIIPLGDKRYLTIPMPLGFHVLPNIGRIPAELVLRGFRDPGKSVANLIGVFAEAFNPIGSAGVSLQTLTPTPLDPLAALAENKDWTGKNIYHEDFDKLKPTPGYTRAKDTASGFGKWVAEVLNKVSGGTDYTPGWASPTPDQIDYLIGQATGGVGREALKAWQAGESILAGEELPAHKRPLIGRFYGKAEGQAHEGGRFYENLKRINLHRQEIEGRRKDGLDVSEYLADNPEARLSEAAKQVERQIGFLRRQKRKMLDRDAGRDEVRRQEERITAVMKRFNDRVKAAEEGGG